MRDLDGFPLFPHLEELLVGEVVLVPRCHGPSLRAVRHSHVPSRSSIGLR